MRRCFLVLACSWIVTPAAAAPTDPSPVERERGPSRAAIGSHIAMIHSIGCATVGGEAGVFAQFPVTTGIRAGGRIGAFRITETCDYPDSADGLTLGLGAEAHFMNGWVDPFFGVDLGVVAGRHQNDLEEVTTTRVAPEIGAVIGPDFRFGGFSTGLALRAHQAVPAPLGPLPLRYTLFPALRASIALD